MLIFKIGLYILLWETSRDRDLGIENVRSKRCSEIRFPLGNFTIPSGEKLENVFSYLTGFDI